MEFTKPTTKTEMYNTLQSIFNYYRIKKFEFEEMSLDPISFSRLSAQSFSDTTLKSRSTTLLAATQAERRLKRRESLETEKSRLTEKIAALVVAKEKELNEIEDGFSEQKISLEKSAYKNGLSHSDVLLGMYADLNNKKTEAIAKAKAVYAQEKAVLEENLSKTEDLLIGCDAYFADIEEREIQAKMLEMSDEREELLREIKKYNDSVSEKEQKYKNNIIQANANLKIKYYSAFERDFTKDELVSMGYYTDVVACVTGYYDTLSAAAAYADIKQEEKLLVYLDSYYAELVYTYKIKA